jgi:SNF2 family DNA or RNA helicase
MTAEEAHAAVGSKASLSFFAKLMPYQRIGFALFLMTCRCSIAVDRVVASYQQQGRILLADEMGLGKTIRSFGNAVG